MAMPAWLGTIFEPLTKVLDEMHTSGEERGAMRLALLQAQIGMTQQVLEYETKLAEVKRDIIVAEAKGESWLQRNWRPLLMLSITGILVWNYIVVGIGVWLMAMLRPDIPPPPKLELPGDLWTLLTFGVSGYIVGRSAEKVTTTLAEAKLGFGKKEE